MPNFYLHDFPYDHPPNCRCRACKGKAREKSFEHFVNRVLLLSTVQSINKFVLSCQDSEPLCFKTWISTAIIRNVRELVVSSDVCFIKLPSCLFTCGTLEILELYLLEINALHLVCLPRLTCLKLVAVRYRDDKSVSKLISGCPTLEFLEIERALPDNVTLFTISSSSLKQRHYRAVLYYPEDHHYKIEINAPALQFLSFSNYTWPGNDITLGSISSLVRADINCCVYSDGHPAASDFYSSVVKLVEALHHVKFLTLSQQTNRALSHGTSCLSSMRFERLTKLTVRALRGARTCLQDLFEAAVNLEALNFTKEDWDDGYVFESCWSNPEIVPRCLRKSLKKVSFGGLEGFEDELAMICYILKHGRVLKQLLLSHALDDINTKFQLLQKISLFPRRSCTCQIAFR